MLDVRYKLAVAEKIRRVSRASSKSRKRKNVIFLGVGMCSSSQIVKLVVFRIRKYRIKKISKEKVE